MTEDEIKSAMQTAISQLSSIFAQPPTIALVVSHLQDGDVPEDMRVLNHIMFQMRDTHHCPSCLFVDAAKHVAHDDANSELLRVH